MELFLPLPGLRSKNFFYNIFSILTKEFKIVFQNRKWNFPNRIWYYFSHLKASDQITSLQHLLHIYQGIQNGFSKQKMELSTQEMELFSHFQASDEKTFFITFSPYLPRNSKWIFKTGNGIIQTGNGIISPISRPPIKKPLLQNIFHFNQGV